MKKLICVLLLIVALASLFTGCVGIFECDLCGETKVGIKHEENVFGTTFTYCNDCKNGMESFFG